MSAQFVYVVIRGWQNGDGPEADIFTTLETAEEHLRLLGGAGENVSDVREEMVHETSFVEEDD